MQPDVNSMMCEQLYHDGYVLCYPGMKTRGSTPDGGESITLDESKTATKIAEMLDPVFDELLKQITVQVQNIFDKMRADMMQRWANQGP